MKNEEKVTIEGIKRKFEPKEGEAEKEKFRQATVLLNLTFAVLEGVSWKIRDCEQLFKQSGVYARVNHEHKQLLTLATSDLEKARKRCYMLSKAVYCLEDAEQACEDSDEIWKFIMLITDRIGADKEASIKLYSTIKNWFPSVVKMEGIE